MERRQGGDDTKMNICNKCDLVKYCNRECQIAHHPQHKKACKKRAAKNYTTKNYSKSLHNGKNVQLYAASTIL